MRPHQRLNVWQYALTLVETVYRLTANFPDGERFGLISQMRRAAVRVLSNIAEGASRRSTNEYLRFLSIARGSLAELDTQFTIAARRGFSVPTPEFSEVLHRTFARLSALSLSLEARDIDTRTFESPIPNPQFRPHHAR